MQPSKVPFDSTYLIEAKHRGRVRLSFCLVLNKWVDFHKNCKNSKTEGYEIVTLNTMSRSQDDCF